MDLFQFCRPLTDTISKHFVCQTISAKQGCADWLAVVEEELVFRAILSFKLPDF
jgi:hypothetical protein